MIDFAERRDELLERLKTSLPDSQEYWQAYCDFLDAEAALDAAMARAEKANGTWELRLVRPGY